LSGDGKPDLAVGIGGGLAVLLGDGSGRFSQAAGSPFPALDGPTSLAIADLNGDGKPDVATANYHSGTIDPGNLTVFLGDGSGALSLTGWTSFGLGPHGIAIGDLNGDGKPDLAAANSTSSDVGVLFNNGLGGFSQFAGSL